MAVSPLQFGKIMLTFYTAQFFFKQIPDKCHMSVHMAWCHTNTLPLAKDWGDMSYLLPMGFFMIFLWISPCIPSSASTKHGTKPPRRWKTAAGLACDAMMHDAWCLTSFISKEATFASWTKYLQWDWMCTCVYIYTYINVLICINQHAATSKCFNSIPPLFWISR